MTASAMQGDREKCLAAGMDDYIAKPVRLEDVRNIVERWGNVDGKSGAKPVEAQVKAEPSDSVKAHASAPPEPPVDMERLLEFTDGTKESLRELVELYLSQTADQLEKLAVAVTDSSAAEMRRVAHSCAGASATCGMRRLVPLLRELERQGLEGKLTGAAELCHKAQQEFKCIRAFLNAYLAEHSVLAPQP